MKFEAESVRICVRQGFLPFWWVYMGFLANFGERIHRRSILGVQLGD